MAEVAEELRRKTRLPPYRLGGEWGSGYRLTA
jgi:hypothetical protein